MQWYYIVQGRQEGPVDDATLEELARRGVIDDRTFVWHEGASGWQPYEAVRPARAPAPQPAPYQAPQPAWVPPPATPLADTPARAAGTGGAGAFFYYPVLRALSDGSVIRQLVVLALRIGAILWALGGMAILIGVIRVSIQLPGAGSLGGILFGVILTVTTLCIAQVYWFRANSVRELEGSAFTVIPIVSILFRLAGETYCTGGIGLGLGACLFMWLSSLSPYSLLGPFASVLPSLPFEGGFLGGLAILVYAAVASFLFLVLMYFFAEMVVLLTDIATSLRRLVQKET